MEIKSSLFNKTTVLKLKYMPKLKTRKAAAKRYKKTGNNNFLRRHAYKGHLLMKK